MKLLLTIFFLLLLAFPLFGQGTGVLYFWEISSRKVWMSFEAKDPNPNINDKFKMGNQMVKVDTLTMVEKSHVGEWKDVEKHC